jgi:hypothetical protein
MKIQRMLQLITIQQQINSIKKKGYKAIFKSDSNYTPPRYSVHLSINSKKYNFADPDYNIIISQLAYFYGNLKGIR